MTNDEESGDPTRRDVLLGAGAAVGTAVATRPTVSGAATATATVETVGSTQIAADAADGDRLWVRRGSPPPAEPAFHVLRLPTTAADTRANGTDAVEWSPEDVQIDLYASYDESGLHLRAEIMDDRHRLSTDETAWAFDALRLAFGRREADAYGPEYVLGYDGDDESYVDQVFAGPDGFDTDRLDVATTVRDDHRTITVTVPWASIPDGEPTDGTSLSFGLAARDRDDGGASVDLSWQEGFTPTRPQISDVGLGTVELLPAEPSWSAALLPPREVDYTDRLPKEIDAVPDRVEVESDDEDRRFRLLAVNHGPNPITLAATVPSANVDRSVTVPPGEALRVAFRPALDSGDSEVTASVTGPDGSGGRETVSRSLAVRRVPDDETIRDRFDEIDTELETLQGLLAECTDAGIPVADERVAATVAAKSTEIGRQDLESGYHGRADEVAREARNLLTRATEACEAYLDGQAVARAPAARYETGSISVDGQGFTATTDAGDERERVFRGFGQFFKAGADAGLFGDMGLNQLNRLLSIEDAIVEPSGDTDAPAQIDTDLIDRQSRERLGGAEMDDLAVEWGITLHPMPDWAVAKYDLDTANPGTIGYNIYDPTAKEILREYLPAAASVAAEYDSLLAVNLTVEAGYGAADEETLAAWRSYLADTHGDVATMNRRYGSNYDSFASVPIAGPFLPSGDLGGRTYDWAVFNADRFADWHAEMATVAHDAGLDAPVYGQPIGSFFRRRSLPLSRGAEPEQFGEACDIWGVDAYNYPGRYNDSAAVGYCDQFLEYDLLTSLSAQPIVEHALHTMRNDESTYHPLYADHLRLSSWQSAIHGVSAMAPWIWHTAWRTDRWDGFQDSIPHRPDAVAAYGRSALDLNRLADEVAAIRDHEPRVALLYSVPAQVYSPRRQAGSYHGAVDEAYRAASLSGRHVGFVSEQQVADGVTTDDFDVVIVPNATNVHAETLSALRTYAEGEGLLVVVGADALTADEYDRPLDSAERRRLGDAAARTLPATAAAADIREALTAVDPDGPVVRLIDTATGEPVDHVEWRVGRLDGRLLVNVANYGHSSVTVRVETGEGTPDQIGRHLAGTVVDGERIELDGLSPALIEVDGATGLRTESRGPVTPTPTETATDTPTASPSPTESSTRTKQGRDSTETDDETTDSATGTTNEESPGFGFGTAVAAGVGAALAWLRRRDDE